MALHYNLSKVYAISDHDIEFAKKIVDALFGRGAYGNEKHKTWP